MVKFIDYSNNKLLHNSYTCITAHICLKHTYFLMPHWQQGRPLEAPGPKTTLTEETDTGQHVPEQQRVMLHFLETSFLSKARCPLRIHGDVCEQVPRKKMSFLVQMFLKSLSCYKAAEHCCCHLLRLFSLHPRLALTLPFTHCQSVFCLLYCAWSTFLPTFVLI